MILVVDDHADAAYVLTRLLRLNGYRAASAGSAREALEAVAGVTPTLFILDYSMPGMDGLELFRRLRADPRLARVPVIMFSGHGDGVRDEALAAGVDAYVVKGSLDFTALDRHVRRLIGSPKAPPQQRRTPPPEQRLGG